jgi:hypothetical protein
VVPDHNPTWEFRRRNTKPSLFLTQSFEYRAIPPDPIESWIDDLDFTTRSCLLFSDPIWVFAFSPIESDSHDRLRNLKLELTNGFSFLLATMSCFFFSFSLSEVSLDDPVRDRKTLGSMIYEYRTRSSASVVSCDSLSSSKSSMRHPEFCCLFRASANATIDRFFCGFNLVNTPQLDRPRLFRLPTMSHWIFSWL